MFSRRLFGLRSHPDDKPLKPSKDDHSEESLPVLDKNRHSSLSLIPRTTLSTDHLDFPITRLDVKSTFSSGLRQESSTKHSSVRRSGDSADTVSSGGGQIFGYDVAEGSQNPNDQFTSRWQDALSRDDFDEVKILLSQGLDVKQPIWCSKSPLFDSVKHSTSITGILIENGADVNLLDTENSATPLTVAICHRKLEIMGVLLRAGADPNADLGNHLRPLAHAIKTSDETALILLRYGAKFLDILKYPCPDRDYLKGRCATDFLKWWLMAEEGSSCDNLDELFRGGPQTGRRSLFDSITWHWEVPATIQSSREHSQNLKFWNTCEHIVLLSNLTACPTDQARPIYATTLANYLRSKTDSKASDDTIVFLDLLSRANLHSTNMGFCYPLRWEPGNPPPIVLEVAWDSLTLTFEKLKGWEQIGYELICSLDSLCRTVRTNENEQHMSFSAANYSIRKCQYKRPQFSLPYTLEARVVLRREILPPYKHDCWQVLFRSIFVADDPRLDWHGLGRGLEASFELLISIAAVEFSLIIGGGVVFVGYQTLLFPTAIQGNCAQFHVITSSNGQINPYTTDYGDRLLTQDWQQFKDMQCFLGWCEAAQINLGTENLPAHVRYSGGRDRRKSLILDGHTATFQFGAAQPIAATMGLQTNFTYVSHERQFTPSNVFSKLLHDASREQAIIYDASDRRGWLVPKLSLLLHMSHAYAWSREIPRHLIPYVDPHSDATGVIGALELAGETLLHGSHADSFYLRQLMLGLNINLLATVASLQRSKGGKLYGFEFMDVVTAPGRGTCMKEFTVRSAGNAWLDICNAVDAVVVCSGLGEAITPVSDPARKSSQCNTLPTGLDYLAATLSCLERLVQRRGGQLTPVLGSPSLFQVSQQRYWHLCGNPFQPCKHATSSRQTCWMRVDAIQRLAFMDDFFQWSMLLRRFKIRSGNLSLSTLSAMPTSGAVVFGRLKD